MPHALAAKDHNDWVGLAVRFRRKSRQQRLRLVQKLHMKSDIIKAKDLAAPSNDWSRSACRAGIAASALDGCEPKLTNAAVCTNDRVAFR